MRQARGISFSSKRIPNSKSISTSELSEGAPRRICEFTSHNMKTISLGRSARAFFDLVRSRAGELSSSIETADDSFTGETRNHASQSPAGRVRGIVGVGWNDVNWGKLRKVANVG